MKQRTQSDIFYNCMAEGIVSRDKCEECFKQNETLQYTYKKRANCVKNNAEKEPTEF